jgi:hypothetical protein
MIWLTLLPFGLFSTCGLATIPICALVGLVMLGAPRRPSRPCASGRGASAPLPPPRKRADR